MRRRLLSWPALFFAVTAILGLACQARAQNYKAQYEKQVKINDATIAKIGEVINYVCPRIVPSTAKCCNPKDPVASALAVEKYMEKYWKKGEEDIEDAKMPPLLNKKAALQFWDAVQQFKKHIPYRKKATEYAKKGDWQNALLNENMAWQYLVKCASRGIFAKKLVSGE